MRVTGTSAHERDGVDVIVRMSGSAYDSWAGFEEITVRSCFTVRVSPRRGGARTPTTWTARRTPR